MLDIVLTGSLIVDRIYEMHGFPVENSSNACVRHSFNFGAIANVYRALQGQSLEVGVIGKVGNDLEGRAFRAEAFPGANTDLIQTCSRPTSSAVILANLTTNHRTSVVDWSACTTLRDIRPFQARWTHVAYLDALPELTQADLATLRNSSQILSADLCKNTHSPEQVAQLLLRLSYFDFLIISDTEATSLGKHAKSEEYPGLLRTATRRGAIVHSKSGTEVLSPQGDLKFANPTRLLNQVNVLGAGDTYCGHLIAALLGSEAFDWAQAVATAHTETFKYIESNSRKQS